MIAMTGLTYLPATASREDILEVLERDAAIIVEGVLSSAQLTAIDDELAPYLANTSNGRNDFSGHSTKRLGALIARSPTSRELALNDIVNRACVDFLGPHGDGYQLHFTQAVSIGPGESAQQLHRDRGVWGGAIPRRIETQLSTIWAISEFTRENGATQVVPGSQSWDKDRRPQPDEIAYAEMKPGSVLIYSGTVIHGGGENQTDERRLGVLIHYTLNWLRQEENQYLSCPVEIARTLTPELRALIGYSRGGPVLGFYSAPLGPGENGPELADPESLFR